MLMICASTGASRPQTDGDNAMRQSRHFAASAVATGVLICADLAWAQDSQGPGDACDREWDLAMQARHQSNHPRALALFQGALARCPGWSGMLRGAVAREFLDLQRMPEAIPNLEACLREESPAAPPNLQELVGGWCRDVAGQFGRVTVEVPSAPPGLRLTVAGRSVSPGEEHLVEPGRVAIEASAPGHQPQSRSVDAARGASLREQVGPLPPVPAPIPPRNPAWLTISGAGAVAIAAGLTSWAIADGMCADSQGPCRVLPQDAGTARTLYVLYPVAVSLGAAAVVGGVVTYLIGPRQSPRGAPRTSLLLTPTSIGVGGTF